MLLDKGYGILYAQRSMYCPKCGASNLATAKFCERCGYSFSNAPVLQTAQAQQSAIELASPLTRFFAFLIDWFVLSFISFGINIVVALLTFTALESTQADNSLAFAFGNPLILAVGTIIYAIVFFMVLGLPAFFGASIGKMLLKIHIVNTSYQKPNYLQILLRETFGKMLSSIILLIGYIAIIFDSENKGWHDRISSTIVVKRKDSLSLNRQPPLQTIILFLVIILFSFSTAFITLAGMHYSKQGEVKTKELGVELERFFDNDARINQEIDSIANIITSTLYLESIDFIALEKLETQFKSIDSRLKQVVIDMENNLTVLAEAKRNLDSSNVYYASYEQFFGDMEEAQQLMIDAIKNYTSTWNRYEKPIAAILSIAKNDARLIQLEKSITSQSSADRAKALTLVKTHGAEFTSIYEAIVAAADEIKAASVEHNFPASLLQTVDNEFLLAKTFVDLANANSNQTAIINELWDNQAIFAQYLTANPIDIAYRAWVDVEVSPNLSEHTVEINRATQKLDDAYLYYDRYVLGIEPSPSPQQEGNEETN